MNKPLSPNSVFNTEPVTNNNNDKRRLLKAFHAFKADPSMYNFTRIERAVSNASDIVYVENATKDFTQSLFGRAKYEGFVKDFNQLFEQ